ncbi:hypothetical protein ACSNOI_31325 [Actinomadura kijaniata]|uniref:hypothetical protein n=1 Tax=Actinomadura kijaniata TaxID=46161 RepID=UPI003F1A7A9D
MNWWSQQAHDSAAEAQAARPSPESQMAVAQITALLSMAEALHKIAEMMQERKEGTN